jgi:hypothetical protein
MPESASILKKKIQADNTTDLGPALTKAWNSCVIPQVTTTVATDVLLYVPAGNFLLKSNVVFDDAKNWNLHIAGNIYLPYIPTLTGTMLTFEVYILFLCVKPTANWRVYVELPKYSAQRPWSHLRQRVCRLRFAETDRILNHSL